MKTENNINSLARLEVQQSFCNRCAGSIKDELKNVEAISNVRLYPQEALIVFNFRKAIALSNTLNVLSQIGYCEKGDRVFEQQEIESMCNCNLSELTQSVA